MNAIAALLCAAVLFLLSAAPAAAQFATGQPYVSPERTESLLSDPAEQARYKALAEELRCLVCQNQTLADSDASLAVDLRRQVEQMMKDGHSDQQIKDFLVARYGDFVLYRPPVQSNTWLLWFGPFALLAVGVVIWWQMNRRRGVASASSGTVDAQAGSADPASRPESASVAAAAGPTADNTGAPVTPPPASPAAEDEAIARARRLLLADRGARTAARPDETASAGPQA